MNKRKPLWFRRPGWGVWHEDCGSRHAYIDMEPLSNDEWADRLTGRADRVSYCSVETRHGEATQNKPDRICKRCEQAKAKKEEAD